MIPVNDDFSTNNSLALGPTRKRCTKHPRDCFVLADTPALQASKKPKMLPTWNASSNEFITNATNTAFSLDDQFLKYRMLSFQVGLGVSYRKGHEIKMRTIYCVLN